MCTHRPPDSPGQNTSSHRLPSPANALLRCQAAPGQQQPSGFVMTLDVDTCQIWCLKDSGMQQKDLLCAEGVAQARCMCRKHAAKCRSHSSQVGERTFVIWPARRRPFLNLGCSFGGCVRRAILHHCCRGCLRSKWSLAAGCQAGAGMPRRTAPSLGLPQNDVGSEMPVQHIHGMWGTAPLCSCPQRKLLLHRAAAWCSATVSQATLQTPAHGGDVHAAGAEQ